jgi:hypothetical protein
MMEKNCNNCRYSEWKNERHDDYATHGQCTNQKAVDLLNQNGRRRVCVGYDYDCPEWMPKLKPAEPSLRGLDSIGSGFDPSSWR